MVSPDNVVNVTIVNSASDESGDAPFHIPKEARADLKGRLAEITKRSLEKMETLEREKSNAAEAKGKEEELSNEEAKKAYHEKVARYSAKLASGGYIAGIGVGVFGEPSAIHSGATFSADQQIKLRKEKPTYSNIEEKVVSVFIEELERFGDNGDEDQNAVEVLKRALSILSKIAAHHGVDIEETLENVIMSEEKTPRVIALEGLAEIMTNTWSDEEFVADPFVFTLNSSKSLTVYKNDGAENSRIGYSKHGHIGGEEFVPVRAYVGKKGHLIIHYRPVQTEPYAWMEMSLSDSLTDLTGFQAHFVRSGLGEKWNEINKVDVEQKRLAEVEKYKDSYEDFGTY